MVYHGLGDEKTDFIIIIMTIFLITNKYPRCIGIFVRFQKLLNVCATVSYAVHITS